MTKHTLTWLVALVLAVGVVVGGRQLLVGENTAGTQAVPITGASEPSPPTVAPEPSPPTVAPSPVPATPTAPSPSTTPTASAPPTPVPARPSEASTTAASRPPASSPATTTAPASTAPATSDTLAPTVLPNPTPPIEQDPGPGAAQPAPPPPPDTSTHIAARYVRHYRAKPASWDDVLDRGRPLPRASKACTAAWRSSGKDRDLDWSTADYWCLRGLLGRSYRPQGVGGSGSTERYDIAGRPASDRNILVTSWYSDAPDQGLFSSRAGGGTITRLVVIDLDQRRYGTVELVRPAGARKLQRLDSHGSGVAWAGQYLYSSSRSALWMYNADDILKIGPHFVLPAIGRWSVEGYGGLSSISIDRSTTPARLNGINYAKAGQAYVQSFDLDDDGSLLTTPAEEASRGLRLRGTLGESRSLVRSARSIAIAGANFQGVATAWPYVFANSSALRRAGSGPIDATVVLRDGKEIQTFRMPRGNVESIYLDYWRGSYVSLTEAGSQFLFTLPLQHLTERAER